ncbi:MAG: NAD(P)-binding domain-containing protein [Gemmatimonadaceae bacterium]|nr:NAD(P)-binding domain-containing protein [Gemmatimonadaceae bacterium]
MDENTLVYVIAAVVIGGVMLPFILRMKQQERNAEIATIEAKEAGLDEPATMHPVVDPERCISTGSCIDVCPEGDVLVLKNGQATPIQPACCIGHGLCERACPVDAIQLVFGTAKRGVDLPRIKQNFETNVPGLYIVGELAGMGLIRNAFEQGKQVVDGILKEGSRSREAGAADLLVIGCGPAGLATSLFAMENGLGLKTIEREDIGGTVRLFPRKKLVMTHPLFVPGYGRLTGPEIQKERLMDLWGEIVHKAGLKVNTQEGANSVVPRDGGFDVLTPLGQYRAKRVIIAIGRRGTPRRLGVPGEELPKVLYNLSEAEAFTNDHIMIVGGGDSAIEAAIALAEQPGNRVTISYRQDKFARIKPANRDRITAAIDKGAVEVLWNTTLQEITPTEVRYRDRSGTDTVVRNDAAFIFAGGELPTAFLKSCGVQIDTKFGAPR